MVHGIYAMFVEQQKLLIWVRAIGRNHVYVSLVFL